MSPEVPPFPFSGVKPHCMLSVLLCLDVEAFLAYLPAFSSFVRVRCGAGSHPTAASPSLPPAQGHRELPPGSRSIPLSCCYEIHRVAEADSPRFNLRSGGWG